MTPYELGWIIKAREDGSCGGVPVGFVASWLKEREPPEGWEWWEPPPELQPEILGFDQGDGGKLVFMCFDDRRAGEECPLVPQCEETNRCLVQMLIEAGWRVERPD